jgi:hypothetical protein
MRNICFTRVQDSDFVPPMTRLTKAPRTAKILRVFLHFFGALPPAGGSELAGRFFELLVPAPEEPAAEGGPLALLAEAVVDPWPEDVPTGPCTGAFLVAVARFALLYQGVS